MEVFDIFTVHEIIVNWFSVSRLTFICFVSCCLLLLTRCCTVCTLKRYSYSLIFFSFLFFPLCFGTCQSVSVSYSKMLIKLTHNYRHSGCYSGFFCDEIMRKKKDIFTSNLFVAFGFFFLLVLPFVGKWLRATINMGNGIGFRVTHKYMELQLSYDKI